jgi:hypothetical protein
MLFGMANTLHLDPKRLLAVCQEAIDTVAAVRREDRLEAADIYAACLAAWEARVVELTHDAWSGSQIVSWDAVRVRDVLRKVTGRLSVVVTDSDAGCFLSVAWQTGRIRLVASPARDVGDACIVDAAIRGTEVAA